MGGNEATMFYNDAMYTSQDLLQSAVAEDWSPWWSAQKKNLDFIEMDFKRLDCKSSASYDLRIFSGTQQKK